MKTEKIQRYDGYLKIIEKVWALKEKAYQETKGMSARECIDYIRNDIKEIKGRMAGKIVKG